LSPGKLVTFNCSGEFVRVSDQRQTGMIMNLASGIPMSIAAGNMLYANGVADLVAPLSLREGAVRWGDGGANNQLVGNYFAAGRFTNLADPQCASVAATLQQFCTLKAVADSSGKIVLKNPLPGHRGNIGRQTIEGPGSW